MDAETIRTAEAYLAKQDPMLGKLIAGQQLEPRPVRHDYFASLCRSIIGQQVSVAAAAAIYGRFEESTNLEPALVASMDDETTKAIGLSKQKTGYLKDLAQHFVDDPQIYDHLSRLEDEAIIAELTAVKGIGVWTAQMFLMFTLGRADVFAPDDIGLQNALIKLHGWEKSPPKKELASFAERWKPYRSVASLHLWQSLDNVPAATY